MTPEQNFAARLDRHAVERPYQQALVMPAGSPAARSWKHRTFAQLQRQVDRYATGLVAAGLRKGDRIVMMVPPGFAFFELSFALWKIGCIPVLIDPGMGLDGFLRCVGQVRPRALMGVPKAMLLSLVKRSAFSSVELRITVDGGTGIWGGVAVRDLPEVEAPFPACPVDDDTEAAILFTSGSTGPAKGVRYTHGMFGTQARLIQEMYGLQAGQTDVPCFLPFAMFSCSIGLRVVLPDMDFAKPATAAPERLVEAVEAFGAHQLVGSPAVMKRLGPWCIERGQRLPTLERILTFGAPIPRTLHASFQQILGDGVDIHTPYGATESLPIATIGSREILRDTGERTARGEGTCVGRPIEEARIAIIAIEDAPIADWSEVRMCEVGEVGEICVRGPQVSREYKDRPDANAIAKVPDGQGFWHRMGDCGYVDAEGRLWFCGRMKHRVVCTDGHTVFPVRLEGVFNEHPRVARSAVVARSGQPALVLELAEGSGDEALAREVLALGEGMADVGRIERVFFHPAFPVDRRHNAKIHRLELARWAEGQTGFKREG